MKILFVNPPVIRFGLDCPEGDLRITSYPFRLKLLCRHCSLLFSLLSYFGIGKGARFGVRAGSRWPWTMNVPHRGPPYPFIMGYAASLLKQEGYTVNIIDAVAEEEYSYPNFISNVKKEQADIVIIECSTPTIDIDLWMAKEISKFAKVAMAGPHISTNAEEISLKYKEICYFLKGEYIINSLKMVQSQIPGIYESIVVSDLDNIPYPFRDYVSSTHYFEPTMPTPKPQLQIYGSKGCPFKCSFCLWPQTMYQGKVSLRDPLKIAEEIRDCVQKYGYKSILFDDDTFNLGTARISILCDELKKIGLPWTMMGRLDCSPDWLFDKMITSGCVGMRFGVETFDLETLKRINKGIERIDFKRTLEHLSKSYPDLYLHLTMMKNLPGQSDQIHQNDMKILKELGFSSNNIYRSFQLASCAPFPGTKMYNDLVKGNRDKLENFQKYDGGQETIMQDVNQ